MNATHTVTMHTAHKLLSSKWAKESEHQCRVTPKRIQCNGRVFNRVTGYEITSGDSWMLSYTHRLLLETLKPLPRVGRNRRAK